MVWYTRSDGEIVSDFQELNMEQCLNYDVDMAWSLDKVGPGEQSSLSIKAKPSSLCSVGKYQSINHKKNNLK